MSQTARRTAAPKASQKLKLPKLSASEILKGIPLADRKAGERAVARAMAAMKKPVKKAAKKL